MKKAWKIDCRIINAQKSTDLRANKAVPRA
jgi:hypothetical protein